MKSLLTCAFGIVALGLWAMPVQAGEPQTIILTGGCQSCGQGGCGNGGCGYKSISAASCCDDDCCKPSCWQKLKDCLFGQTKEWCEPACEKPCDRCDECKPSWCDKLKSCFKKKDCCEPVCEKQCDPCCEKKKLFNFSFKKKNDCCDDCGTIHAAPAPAITVAPKAEPEKIGLPMPK
jgi:hypothetical protein